MQVYDDFQKFIALNRNFIPIKPNSPSPPSEAAVNLNSIFSLCEFAYFCFVGAESCNIFCVSGLFHLACIQDSSMFAAFIRISARLMND
jgi:hypothetical protein